MFKLLLVDDEAFVRNGILRRIDWQSLGIDEVRQAEDGLLALEQLSVFSPDILLTDVKMPRMNGIDLSHELLKRLPSCKIVFMSGYTDVIYLKSAIELNAVCYIEKPIQLPELEQTLRRTVEKCLCEKREKQTHALLEETVKMSVPLLKSELAAVLLSPHPDGAYLAQLNQTLGLPLDGGQSYLVLTADFPGAEERDLSEAANLLSSALKKFNASGWQEAIFCQRGEKQLAVLLIGYRKSFDLSELFGCLSALPNLRTPFCIGAGRPVDGREKIHDSYLSSQASVQSAFYFGYDRLLFPPPENESPFHFPPAAKLLAPIFESADWNGVQQGMKLFLDCLARIRERPDIPPDSTKDWFYRLLLSFSERCAESFPNVFQTFEDHAWLYQFSASSDTLGQLSDYFLTKVRACQERCAGGAHDLGAVGEMVRFIERNYTDPNLSIASICENTFISISHACFLFKKQTGYTLNQYITEYRIKMAKNMLANPSSKIVNIAEAVGFSDANYFTKAFKKATGLTPSAFREELLS